MGLTCSLLGHRFGDPVVEQDREDRGREAVTVTREVVICERCGERRIRSESTEVAAVADDGRTEGDEGAEPGPDPDPGSETAGGADSGPGTEPEARTDGDATTVEEAEPADDDPAPDPAAAEGEPTDEGAEILTGEPESEERGFGEWPEAPDTTPGPAEQSDDQPDTDDGVAPETGPEDTADTDTGTHTGTETEAEEFKEAAGADDGPARLTCPDCGFSVAATGSPLRAGDACPDCSAAYLAERNQ